MRHGKHRFSLGCKKEHREALMANLASALFEHGKINTTLAKAKALRPFAEKLITMSVKAHRASDAAEKLHYRRLVISRIRSETATKELFDVKAVEFINRHGGYTRTYKLVPRIGDAAKMAIIELVYADDKGYSRSRKGRKKAAKQNKLAKVESKEIAANKSGEAAVG
ncbi:MAG: 50S ribosomal protein L17 [Puniceicoccales bacterium]|jgi:large subunit ribosomal protein L17|nr:50S ribosomal protein L17 [Puniceicoccales bacterium]